MLRHGCLWQRTVKCLRSRIPCSKRYSCERKVPAVGLGKTQGSKYLPTAVRAEAVRALQGPRDDVLPHQSEEPNAN